MKTVRTGALRFIGSRYAYLRYVVATSFWFVPAMMMIGSAALAVIAEGTTNTSWLASLLVNAGLLPAESEKSRLILSTIIGSIITVTTLVFSMTLIALSQAAQQLGPRLLAEFRGSKKNQVVLGAFVGTVFYALLTLTMASDPVPVTSVFVAVVLVIVCFGLLIFFIHHVARSMEADHIIALVASDIENVITKNYTLRSDLDENHDRMDAADVDRGSDCKIVHAKSGGYVQTMDYTRLVDLAACNDVVLNMCVRPGKFVVTGAPIGTITPPPDDGTDIDRAINLALVIGRTRTAAQDVEFSIKSMVEVALRALSPGVNDVFTAITCIDRLGAAMALAMRYGSPPTVMVDDEGSPRVIRDPVTFEGLMDIAFNEIRQNLDANEPGLDPRRRYTRQPYGLYRVARALQCDLQSCRQE